MLGGRDGQSRVRHHLPGAGIGAPRSLTSSRYKVWDCLLLDVCKMRGQSGFTER